MRTPPPCVACSQNLNEEQAIIRQGGGAKAIEAQHKKKRLTARERLDLLLDPGTEFHELSIYAAHGMYADYGGAPAAGTVTGIGRVADRLVMVIANDATVKAGAFFPMTAKKVLRAQTIAIENRIPTLYLVDSSGVFLPLQEDVFPDQDDFGRVFRNNAVMQRFGHSADNGDHGHVRRRRCVSSGDDRPGVNDRGQRIVSCRPGISASRDRPEVYAGEVGRSYGPRGDLRNHRLQRAQRHVVYRAARSLVDEMAIAGPPLSIAADATQARMVPSFQPKICTDSSIRIQNAPRAAMTCGPGARADSGWSEFDEYKADYGKTVICGYGRIGGFAVGIVANQKRQQSQATHAGEKQVEFGGVLYAESADKAARFIMDCNQNLVPLIFLHDVNGFMVGRDAEWSGIIRAGAKMVAAVANSTVPKITVIVGGSFGAGHYAMCGKAYDPRFVFAWPTAKYAVMSGASRRPIHRPLK